MRPRHAARRRRGLKRVILAAGAVLVAGVGVTVASFDDEASLALGEGGVGYANRFDIAVVQGDGTVVQADAEGGVDWVVDGAQTLAPGHTISTSIPVFNNTPDLAADVSMEIVLLNGDGTVSPGVPNITPFLRFSAQDSAGTVLFDAATWDQAKASLGALSARGEDVLSEGDAYTPGDATNADIVLLSIEYLDVDGVEAFNGGQSALAVHFAASSIAPEGTGP